MVDIAAFPAVHDILVSGDNIQSFIAGAAITAGQVVAFADTGVSDTVHPAVTGTTASAVGVALYTVASGERVAVACDGCVVNVVNGIQGTDIDAGHWVEYYGTTTPGTVKELVTSGGVAVNFKLVGKLLEDNTATAAGTSTKCLIATGPVTPGA